MDINKYIGNKIRNFREQKNLTQEEVAEYLNTTPQTISTTLSAFQTTPHTDLPEMAMSTTPLR